MTQATDILSAERIAEIRERERKATAGPWRRRDGVPGYEVMAHNYNLTVAKFSNMGANSDSEFTMHARADIPALLASHDALAAKIKRIIEQQDGGLMLCPPEAESTTGIFEGDEDCEGCGMSLDVHIPAPEFQEMYHAQAAEIARLREQVASMEAIAGAHSHASTTLVPHALKSEIARLREALETCVDIIEEAQVCIGAGEMDTAALKLAKAALKGPRDE